MRVHLETLGCRLNEAETEHWSREFQAQGYNLAQGPQEPDLIVINTCAVTREAARKSRKRIRRIHRDHPQAKLVVSGCYASLEPEETVRNLGVDLVIDNRDKDRLVAIARQRLDLNTMPEIAMEAGENALFARGRQRAFVKVQDGCRYRCSFCIVTIARGEERSRSLQAVVDEVNQLQQQGVQEVVLTGVHIGGYGNDLDSDLYRLVHMLLAETAIPRLRLGSVEPWDLPSRFWELFDNPRCMPHLHLPLQSGADSVLRRMSRRCRSGDFAALIEQARRQVVDFNVTTDIIVGFPGESEQEWRQTLAFVERIGFGDLHIFAYSPREGTKAAGLPDQVSAETKRRRSQEIQALGRRIREATQAGYLGREFPVLIEGSSENSTRVERHWRGYTPNFLRVNIAAGADAKLGNSIRQVRLERLDPTDGQLHGRLLD